MNLHCGSSKGLGGGMLSGSNEGILDLETSIQKHQQSQLDHQQHHMNFMSGLENDQSLPIGLLEVKGPTRRGISLNFIKGKTVGAPLNGTNYTSEEDEPCFSEDGNGENVSMGKGQKNSPWQRMKWTDNVVRLLIAVVSCVGEDDTVEAGDGAKRKSGILQKKGKWKTVSKIMISKGCHVSPQQCEDKFNDLNKRYKRLNDILGRGTSCRVVENPSLMDSMPQLSDKAKDDVRKILSSKHLFYKEMCAYHNGQRIPDCHDIDLQCSQVPIGRCSNDHDESEEEEAEELDDCDDDELENAGHNSSYRDVERMGSFGLRKKVSEDDGHLLSQAFVHDSFEVEMAGIFQDPTKTLWERREWIKKQMLQLQEQRVDFQAQAFELEKQRFKWLRYCSKKDRELERLRLENERMKLENEQRVLQLKQKELEMDFKRPEGSSEPTSFGIDRLQGRNLLDLGRLQ